MSERLLEPLRGRPPGPLVGSIVFVFHICVGLVHGGPVAVPDVSAYLAVSQWFHGGILPADLAFHPGYGLLLAPFGWLEGEHLHSAALLINGAFAALCVPIGVRLATMFGADRRTQWLAAILIAISPSMALSARIAWPETLLTLVLLGTAVLVHKCRWDWAGALTGLVIAVHPRTIVLALALLIVATGDRDKVIKLLRGLIPTVMLTAGLLTITGTWPGARVYNAIALDSGPDPVSTLMGQWLAFVAATGGIAALGFFTALRSTIRRRRCDAKAFLAVSALGMFFLGAWTLAGSSRVDTLLYGRYIGPWTLALALVGLTAIRKSKIERSLCAAMLVSAISAVTFCLAAANQTSEPVRRIMTLELGILWSLLGENLNFILLSAGVISCLGILSFRRGPLISLIILGLIAVPSTWVNHRHLHNVGQIAEGQTAAASALPLEATCLAHDISAKHYSLWLYRLELPEVEHKRVNLASGAAPCGNHVIAGTEALKFCDAAEMVIKEPRANWGLWTYPTQGCG